MACSTSRVSKSRWPNEPIPLAAKAGFACKVWSRALPSHISHISLSADGTHLYVSTSAEPGKTMAALRLYGPTGKQRWFRKQPQPVKSQDISDDGAFIAINTYDGKLRLLDASGRALWEREHMGRPVVLSAAKRILLFNDDDSEAGMAFVSYDLKGRETGRVVIAHDDLENAEPLDMYLSTDESGVAVAMAGEGVAFYDLDGQLLAKGHLPGRTVSIASLGKPEPRLFAISTDDGGDQTLTLLLAKPNGGFEKKWSVDLARRYETLRLVGETLVLYGNTEQGQAVSGFSALTGERLWQRAYSSPATYPSLVFGTHEYTTLLLDTNSTLGSLDLLAIDNTGSAIWRGSVAAPNGVFSYSFAPLRSIIAIGAGEPGRGIIHYYKAAQPQCR